MGIDDRNYDLGKIIVLKGIIMWEWEGHHNLFIL